MTTNRVCVKCGETFELSPAHRGFANVCEPSCGIDKPREVYAPSSEPSKLRSKPWQRRATKRKPMSPEQAARQMDNAIRGMAKLLATIDPKFAPMVQSLTGKRFNRHVAALRSISKGEVR